MKKIAIYLALLVGVVVSLSTAASIPVQAQEDLDTILARSAANGFLITLTRPELSSAMRFYLVDDIDGDGIVAQIGPVAEYEITRSDWLTSGETYEVEAVLQPGKQTVVIHTGKHGNRWRVEDVELISDAASGSTSVASGAGLPAVELGPVAGNGSGKLAFQTQNGGDIYVINADGTGLRRVSHGIDPQLSPDGTKIAFTRWDPAYELFTINIDGTNEMAWFGNRAQMKSPTWSADGSRLVFSYLVSLDPGGFKKFFPGTLWIRSIREGGKINWPTIPDNARGVKTNPDGSIEYTIPPDAHWHLAQVDLNKNEYQDIATGSSYNYAPAGLPIDSNKLLYRGDKGIAMYDTAAQTGQPVSFDGSDRGALAISPDGTKIALTYWQNGHWEIHTMNIDGSNRQRLTETPLNVLADNSRSEVIITEEGYKTLTRAQPDGQLNPHWNNAAPVWSPDGSMIAFMTDRTGKWEVWIMKADGSDQHPMFPNGVLDQLDFDVAGVDERMLSWQ